MKHSALTTTLLLTVLCLISSAASASTWYVTGVSGSDSNTCKTPTTACKTIGHAISLASSGDSIMVAAATYTENLTINFSLKMSGASASTTIIDGGLVNTVVTISNASARVTLSKLTIKNGYVHGNGGGIYNDGTLTINNSTVTGNVASSDKGACGGGIINIGTLTTNKSTISGNLAVTSGATSGGGGICNGVDGTVTINNSTLSGNTASIVRGGYASSGGGIYNDGTLTINNSTVSGNSAYDHGGGIVNVRKATLQNSIVSNSRPENCYLPITSNGYNLSSDGSCNFNNTGDRNNTDPLLGQLGNYGGPTQTMPLLSGSPAIDAGNPNGCTDGNGHLLKTDQRGKPRPDTEDTGGCDMGAYERQSD